MVDVHAHIIPCVDDGSRNIDESIAMLKDEIDQGVNAVICTPHYRRGSYVYRNHELTIQFEDFCNKVKEIGLNIDVFLGREITYCDSYYKKIKDGDVITMAGSKYLLIELPYGNEIDVDEMCYRTIHCGYIPIIAHIERYKYCRKIDVITNLRKSGVLIQVNASSIIGKCSFFEKRFVSLMLKKHLVDVVGSDVHYRRVNYIGKAYECVARKDREYADLIFAKNAQKIIGDIHR